MSYRVAATASERQGGLFLAATRSPTLSRRYGRLDAVAAVPALGEYLRARRAQVRPGDVGLPAGVGLRRIPGLRREELAALAGVSIDYYIRLEQGRETNPSGAVLDALATALVLDDDARAHLYALANQTARRTPAVRRSVSRTVRPGLLLLLENLRPSPAYVLSRTSDVLASNPEGLALFAGLSEWPALRRNTIRYTFLHPAARSLLADWSHSAAAAVSNLRSLLAEDSQAPDVMALVDELTSGSPEFDRLWQRYDVRPRRSDIKAFHHPAVGDLALQHEVLRLDDGQRLTVYQAADGTADRDAVTLLSMTTRTHAGDATGHA